MMDLVTYVTRMPERGETLEAPEFALAHGGKGRIKPSPRRTSAATCRSSVKSATMRSVVRARGFDAAGRTSAEHTRAGGPAVSKS